MNITSPTQLSSNQAQCVIIPHIIVKKGVGRCWLPLIKKETGEKPNNFPKAATTRKHHGAQSS